MNEKRKKASMKIFGVESSSRSSSPTSHLTTPDPYSDDGQNESDQDYDPCNNDSESDNSGSNLRSSTKANVSGISSSDNSIDSDHSSSSESIFDTRLTKQNRTLEKQNSLIDKNDLTSLPSCNISVMSDTALEVLSPTMVQEILQYTSHAGSSTHALNPQERESSPATAVLSSANIQSAPTNVSEEDPILQTTSIETEQSHSKTASPSTLGRNTDLPTHPMRLRTPTPLNDWEHTAADIPIFDFDENSVGAQFEIGPHSSVMDIFNKLFPPNIVDYIVSSTNAYGRALCSTNRPATRNSRMYRFKDTDREEILKFLGLCLLMGQVSVPKKSNLFTYSNPLYFHPIFPYTMSARRFEQLLRCLCVSERGAQGKNKIVGFIDILSKNFREMFKPGKELSLDESMLLFRGRLSFRQYIKSKKAKYGIKFYELTTHDGYVLNVLMYAGKCDEDTSEKGKKTEGIVMNLMKPYLLKGHSLFMDNFYNSVPLSQKLLDLKTHTVGTLRRNRQNNPKDLFNKKLKVNEHVWVRKNKVYVSKWQDKRSVFMITTLNHPKLVEVSNRHGKKRMKPLEVSTYNQFMSGIDRTDQMISYYSTPRKTVRWYKKVFFHFLDIAVWNSYYLYKRYCKNSTTYEFKSFREELIKDLIKVPPNLNPLNLMIRHKNDNRLTNNDLPPPMNNTHNSGHWPEIIPVKPGSKKTTYYMKCKMCAKKKTRRETRFRCKGCEEKPALCASCFEESHSLDH